ncbi:MAG: rod shape-determining protein MreC [Nitrospira sp.]|nr:rod shape-determining protein MreC [Nitrospira sp.]
MYKKKIFLFSLFLLFVFGLLTYQSIKGGPLLYNVPLLPMKMLERSGSAVIKSVNDFLNTFVLISGRQAELESLRLEIQEHDKEKNSFLEADLENRRLRRLLDLKSERPDYVAAAEVFARDPTNWFQVLWINKGSDSGIEKDMVAVTPSGPVGRIHRVFERSSDIILLTDVNSSVAVRLQESRQDGILAGNGDNRCFLKYISKNEKVLIGERVVTSGLDGIYPEGLLIGTVTEKKTAGDEIFQIIEVTLSQSLNEVEEILILKR